MIPDEWDDDLSDFYILESSEAPLPTMLPSEAKRHEENLRLLSSFFTPLPFEERVRQEQLYSDPKGGQCPGLSADDVKLAMIEIAEGWR